MLFSIIVPIYNVQQYIHRCIQSLQNQTYRDIEIILVDDGSTDDSSQICDIYAKADERVKIIHKKNGGLSDARNAGISIAQGEYIIFVDSDDYIELDTCEKFLEHICDNKIDILIGEAFVEGGKMSLAHITNNSILNGTEYLLCAYKESKSPMAVWLNIYNRKFLLDNNLKFKYGILHEDEEFTPRALLVANSIKCTNIFFYHYIIRENSITTKKDKRKNASDLYQTCCELEKIYRDLSIKELKKLLLDSLVVKYLNLFQVGKLFQYGKEFLHKDFIWRNAKLKKTKVKSLLYIISPRGYYWTNLFVKKLAKKGIF